MTFPQALQYVMVRKWVVREIISKALSVDVGEHMLDMFKERKSGYLSIFKGAK